MESGLSNLPEPDNNVFSCPEKGCIKVNWDFKYHLNCGKHNRMPEQETLLDKAVLIELCSKIEQRVKPLLKLRPVHTSGLETKLPMGWALKITSSRIIYWLDLSLKKRAVRRKTQSLCPKV